MLDLLQREEGAGDAAPSPALAPAREAAPWTGVAARLWRLAWPIVLARIGVMTMGVVDSVAVGRFSSRELAYQALGWAPTAVILTAGIGLLAGVQVMAARRVGEGRPELAGAGLRQGLIYAAAIGAASGALLIVGGPSLLRALGLEADVTLGAARVMTVLALSVPFILMASTCSFWLEGLGRPAPGMWAMLVANLVNLALNLWLVPGGWGVAAMGAVGACWATVTSRGVVLALLLAYIAMDRRSRTLGVFTRGTPDPEAAREQRRIGYGAGASYFVESGAFAGMNVIAAWVSPLAVAAWSVVLNVTALIFMVPLGLAGATAVLVGTAYGAGDRAGVVRAAVAGCAAAGALALAVSLATWPGAGLIALGYATDPALIGAATAALVLGALFFPPDAVQVVLAQALRARGDVVLPTLTHTVAYAFLMLPLAYALALTLRMGLTGVLLAVIVSSWAAAAFLVVRFAWLTRRDALRPAPAAAISAAP